MTKEIERPIGTFDPVTYMTKGNEINLSKL